MHPCLRLHWVFRQVCLKDGRSAAQQAVVTAQNGSAHGLVPQFATDPYEAVPALPARPQRIDLATLHAVVSNRLFDAISAIVRHPVSRTFSTDYSQLEVEKSIRPDLSFSGWLDDLEAVGFEQNAYNKRAMPISRLVPDNSTVFHLRHVLDALTDWLDLLTGCRRGPRSILTENVQGALTGVQTERTQPSADNRARIARLYAEDSGRSGHNPAEQQPMLSPPELSATFVRRQQRVLHLAHALPGRLQRKVLRHLRRL